MFKAFCLRVLAVLVLGLSFTASGAVSLAHADDFLDPDVAFKLTSEEQPGVVDIHFAIAKGYYLYRERFAFDVSGDSAKLGDAVFPPSQSHFDPTLQKTVETYRGDMVIHVPVVNAAGPFDLVVTSQGCADAGICYPPMQHKVHVAGAAFQPATTSSTTPATPADGAAPAPDADNKVSGAAPASTAQALVKGPGVGPAVGAANGTSAGPSAATTDGATDGSATSAVAGAGTESNADASAAPSSSGSLQDALQTQGTAERLLAGHSWPYALGAFFLIGIGLSLLPCTWPMVPILASIIVGQGAPATRSRGLVLSIAYVLGSACVYAILGVAAGLAGASLTVWLQNPWVLGAFGLLLVAFALSMFGLYELQMPAAWQSRVDGAARRASGGQLAGVFLMGALSALVVGACMTAPLFAVLAYIAQTGNAVFGGAALFAMALGIGVPLLIVGAGAGALLPRAGTWMETVKRIFGMLLLGVALYIVYPVLPTWATMLAIALWALVAASLLGTFESTPPAKGAMGWRIGKGAGLVLAVLAVIQLVGVAGGSRDPLAPLGIFTGAGSDENGIVNGAVSGATAGAANGAGSGTAATANAATLSFAPVASTTALDAAVSAAQRPSMLDFYADWCVSCREMEKFTFTDPRVHARLVQLQLLRADVTANNPDDQALLKRFSLFGPPGIIFFDRQGGEVKALRVVGFQSADVFLRSLERAFGPAPKPGDPPGKAT
jgi:thiol:disulfide interchange protein DsbD